MRYYDEKKTHRYGKENTDHMALISCINAAIGYEGMKVVTGLCFTVNPGDYLCIVGENGSGKSTLMKTILGLIPAISGTLTFGGGLEQTEIGYLPQQTETQRDFPATVWEITLSGCLNRCGLRPFYNQAEKALARKNLEKLGIRDIANSSYQELSGGQQQRVLLARALCATQKILLLDEPAAGLDPLAGKELYQIIDQLNRKDGITVIMISHDIASATHYASHILHIGNHPLFFGTKQDYLHTDVGKLFHTNDEGKPCDGNHYNWNESNPSGGDHS